MLLEHREQLAAAHEQHGGAGKGVAIEVHVPPRCAPLLVLVNGAHRQEVGQALKVGGCRPWHCVAQADVPVLMGVQLLFRGQGGQVHGRIHVVAQVAAGVSARHMHNVRKHACRSHFAGTA